MRPKLKENQLVFLRNHIKKNDVHIYFDLATLVGNESIEKNIRGFMQASVRFNGIHCTLLVQKTYKKSFSSNF